MMKIFLDGPNIDEIKKIKNINGYTFNPTLFKKLVPKIIFNLSIN